MKLKRKKKNTIVYENYCLFSYIRDIKKKKKFIVQILSVDRKTYLNYYML